MKRKVLDPAVGSRVTSIRNQAGLTQHQLAKRWKVSQTCIKTFEAGRVPHPTFLMAYAELGGVTLEWLLTGEVDNRYIDRRLKALDGSGRDLINRAIGLLGDSNRALETQFSAFLDLLAAARGKL